MKNAKLFILFLYVIINWGCGKDLEEPSIDIVSDIEITISGQILTSHLNSVGGGLFTMIDNVIEDAQVNVYKNSVLIEQTTSDTNGSFNVQFIIEEDTGDNLILEVLKEGYWQHMEFITPDSQQEKIIKLLENNDDIDEFMIVEGDEIEIKGSVAFDKRFSLRINYENCSRNRFSSFGVSAIDSFQVVLPRNVKNVEVRIFNELGCEASIQEGTFLSTYSTDVDLGELTAEEIFIDDIFAIPYNKPQYPECVEEGQIILNGAIIEVGDSETFYTCDDVQELEILMINYDDFTRTEFIKLSPEELINIDFVDCIPYEYEFEITTPFGIFTHETESVKVFSNYYTTFSKNDNFESMHFVVQLNNQWEIGFTLLGLVIPGDPISYTRLPNSSAKLGLAVLRRIGEEINESSATSMAESGDIPFEVRDGYFLGRKENIRQYVNGTVRAYGYELKVPVPE